eukprot:6178421-Pleurochrysis_carterae.AAC.1
MQENCDASSDKATCLDADITEQHSTLNWASTAAPAAMQQGNRCRRLRARSAGAARQRWRIWARVHEQGTKRISESGFRADSGVTVGAMDRLS